jgi:hypothetical protein
VLASADRPTLPKSGREDPRAAGQERHSRLIDCDGFVNAPVPEHSDITDAVPVDPVDIRLRCSAALDAGRVIPDDSDGHPGKAPDLAP